MCVVFPTNSRLFLSLSRKPINVIAMETMLVKRKGSGRRKIEIKKIENKNALQVTFSKRRTGLFRKAAELSRLCGVDIAVLVESPAGNIFASGGQAPIDSIIDRYVASTSSSSNKADPLELVLGRSQYDHDEKKYSNKADPLQRVLGRGQCDHDEKKCGEILKEIEDEKRKEKSLMESKGGKDSNEFWWKRRIDDLSVSELEDFSAAMEGLRKNLSTKIDEMTRA